MKPYLIDEDPRSNFQSSTAPKSEFLVRKCYRDLGLQESSLDSNLGFSLERFELNEIMKPSA